MIIIDHLLSAFYQNLFVFKVTIQPQAPALNCNVKRGQSSCVDHINLDMVHMLILKCYILKSLH